MVRDEHRKKLNTLCYQILGVLLREARSGYEIVKQLEYIRPVKTSQVYPTLTRLQQQGLVTATDVPQEGRPDKKVYDVTAQGRAALTDWIGTEPEPPVLRDDFLTMVYSAWTKEPEEVVSMFERRLEQLRAMKEEMETVLAKHQVQEPQGRQDPRNWRFFREHLLLRRIGSLQQEMLWSRGVIEALKDSERIAAIRRTVKQNQS